MDKTLMIFIGIGIGAFYLLTNFLGTVEADPNFKEKGVDVYDKKHKNNQFMGENIIGEPMLKVSALSNTRQIAVWNNSSTKSDIINYFPEFTIMNNYANRNIDGDYIKGKVISKLEYLEGEYVSGLINKKTVVKELTF